jgi:hypothetical protein
MGGEDKNKCRLTWALVCEVGEEVCCVLGQEGV